VATSGTGLARGTIGLREVLYTRHPERLPEMKKVFADDIPPEPVTSGGAA
jgi:hypothetical protein